MVYIRSFVDELKTRIFEENPLIQVVLGPRQVGKTMGIKQLLERVSIPSIYSHADDLLSPNRSWLIEHWQKTMALGPGSLLVVDEIQKIPNWSEIIKALWDENPYYIKLIVLGSSSLQLQKGLSESLAGRFELLKVYQWSYGECKKAFNYSLDHYLVYGGYPGAVPFEKNFDRWKSYIKDSIIEAAISKDIFQDNRVGNPALFRQAFEILCHYPAQEISYTKLLGQLQSKGNSDLVKHYTHLYSGAFLANILHKYSPKAYLSKTSSPKILIGCPALVNFSYQKNTLDNDLKGRLFELIIGNRLISTPGDLYYWRESNHEVDFVYIYHGVIYAIEVKSGKIKPIQGLDLFKRKYPMCKQLVITLANFESFDADPLDFIKTYSL